MSRYTKCALICAILPIMSLAGGCAVLEGEGHPGYDEFKAGHFEQARMDFQQDIADRPNSPIAQFNMGDSYRQAGDNGQADGMFHTVAADGKNFAPDEILELGGTNRDNVTANAVACRHLHEDRQLDANCGDQIVAVVTPPAAEPAPAVEAEATTPAPAPAPVYKRKQDRN
jgi:tetratricopeptide (TPR) repeat protein